MPRPAVLADLLFISVICLRPMQPCSLPLCRRFSPTPRPRWRVLVWAVNSPGGSVSAGMAIYDTMQYIPCDLATVCFGTAASMGAFLLCSGTPGKRKSLPNSRIMIHQPLGGAQGQAADIEIQAKEILFVKSLLNSYMADATGQPLDKIEEDTDRDFFMTPEEAMQYGAPLARSRRAPRPAPRPWRPTPGRQAPRPPAAAPRRCRRRDAVRCVARSRGVASRSLCARPAGNR